MKKATVRSFGWSSDNGIWCNGNITVYFFEDQVHLDHTSFIDGYIEKTHVMIEQKSINKSLTAAIRQSDGSMLTPLNRQKDILLNKYQEFLTVLRYRDSSSYIRFLHVPVHSLTDIHVQRFRLS